MGEREWKSFLRKVQMKTTVTAPSGGRAAFLLYFLKDGEEEVKFTSLSFHPPPAAHETCVHRGQEVIFRLKLILKTCFSF